MRFSARTILVTILLAMAMAAVPIWYMRTPTPVVDATTVRRAPLRVLVSTNGKVEPVRDVEIRARLDGLVLGIPDAGKQVAAGDVVVRIDDGAVASDLAAARSDRIAALDSLRAARAAADAARKRYATDRDLFDHSALTREALEASETSLRDAEARLAALEKEVPFRVASLEQRAADLAAQREGAVVRAPFAGTLYKAAVKQGAAVHAGDLLLRLGDLDAPRVRANIDQVDLGRVRPGQRVRITANAHPGQEWVGHVSEIVPDVSLKESRAVSEGLVNLDSPADGLVPGMTVDVQVIVAEAPSVLQIPADAVFAASTAPFVYRIDGSRVRRTPVTTGMSNFTMVEITDGLNDGDMVVVGPAVGLKDGTRVAVQPAADAHS